MAKRHKGDEPVEGEDYEFIPEEFDEDHFIHKEMVSFHTTSVLFFTGIVAALVSWGLFASLDGSKTGWLVGLVIAAIFFGALRPIFRVLNVDIKHWGRREWLGTAFLMFFAWLAFFIMFVNPPISDFSDPEIIVYTSPAAAAVGDDVVFDVFFLDNHEVAKTTFTLTGPGTSATMADLSLVSGHHYQYILNGAAGTYTWSASAVDKHDRRGSATGEVAIAADVLQITIGDLTDPLQSVFVRAPEAVDPWAVYAQLKSGGRVYLEEDPKVGGWVATANFMGWEAGNNTFDIVVEQKNSFQGQTLIEGGRLTKGPYTVEVPTPGSYDASIPKRDNTITPPNRAVPGIGLPLLAVGLIGAAVVVRRRA